jgi:general L-amino acid transport system permease protein
MWGFMFFSAAYLAENVRGGLQAIPKGQYEAAEALGLNTFQQMRFIILPQALRLVIPPMTGQFIGLFKDTSLVAIVGLFDLLNIANAVIAQPQWLGLRREAYFFITIIYYVGCYVIAAMGTWLERRTGLGQR